MSINFNKLLSEASIIIEEFIIPEEEQQRLRKISTNPCPVCKGPMLVGDDEYMGACELCYGDA